jgi:D-alanyl-lipoteichoic acid acyltransferase DltB (MBOAT superfamily)
LLGIFKYVDFFIANIKAISNANIELIHIVLPLGISFFTFTQIAYLVDAFKGKAKDYSIWNYSLFVTFYPHLLAGPIIHHSEMMPQFDRIKNKILNYRFLSAGLFLFAIGLFKKVIIADWFADVANKGYSHVHALDFCEAWITSLSYSIQLYFDFSGYTDMALGSALMFNIQLPLNFNSPYRAQNIQDFWRRWHITLSRFLRDYIYIPLGGNRATDLRILANFMATFLIGGIWHGAGWTFVFWGFLHGIAMVIHRLWKKTEISMPKIVAWFITFNFVNFAWIFFRSNNFNEALSLIKAMIGLNGIVLPTHFDKVLGFLGRYGVKFGTVDWSIRVIVMIFICLSISILFKNSNKMVEDFKPSFYNSLITSCLLFICLFSMMAIKSEFIYFQF